MLAILTVVGLVAAHPSTNPRLALDRNRQKGMECELGYFSSYRSIKTSITKFKADRVGSPFVDGRCRLSKDAPTEVKHPLMIDQIIVWRATKTLPRVLS
jgi:hypothetical protein